MHLQNTQAYWTGNFYLESLFKTELAMIIKKYRLMPEEFSCSSFVCIPQERAEELTRVFRILIPDLRIGLRRKYPSNLDRQLPFKRLL